MSREISKEEIYGFLNGKNPMEHVTCIECGYQDDKVSLIIRNEDKRLLKQDDFFPFCWVKRSACVRMYHGDREKLKYSLLKSGIKIKKLITKDENEKEEKRLINGFEFLFYADRKMSYSDFMKFFEYAGTPIYPKKKDDSINRTREFFTVSPVEQYMIKSGIRLFKGYDNYDDLNRFVFDLETQGLDPLRHAIDLNGLRTNKGFEKILFVEGDTEEERRKSELKCIRDFLKAIYEQQPDIVLGYNSENFDWNFIIERLKILGSSLEEETKNLFPQPIYKKKKQQVLKLGGEIEYYNPTIMWGTTILDGLHAVRRAQAIDSNIKSANLKSITKYAKLNKPNRVYIPGDKITDMWKRTNKSEYAFNDNDGKWYFVDEKHPLRENYKLTSGRYIVERYNLDDIWETDKVDVRFNESNFLLCKMIPTSFQRACTMGTAGIWKLIMAAWSFENDLAIPDFSPNRRFVGGLSRLLKVGYVDNIVKLDFNSLYPSIMISWHVQTKMDVTNAMLTFLEYILSEREKFKGLKKEAGKKADEIENKINDNKEYYNLHKNELKKLKLEKQNWSSEKNANDKKQLPFKIFGNSFFGAYGSPQLYPWGDLICAEKTTCIGRQSLRLMISWFTKRGYSPIVGDSFLGDTPLFIKYNDNGFIDIKLISEIIEESKINIDALGREYDYSKKPYKVLCRSGWSDVKYIYRHKTEKDIYEVCEIAYKNQNGCSLEVTEDHSLFNDEQKKISPNEINKETKLEKYNGEIGKFGKDETVLDVQDVARKMWMGEIDRVPIEILNGSKKRMDSFYKAWLWAPFTFIISDRERMKGVSFSKTAIAGIEYIGNMIRKK
jgi:DNA polymerase I